MLSKLKEKLPVSLAGNSFEIDFLKIHLSNFFKISPKKRIFLRFLLFGPDYFFVLLLGPLAQADTVVIGGALHCTLM